MPTIPTARSSAATSGSTSPARSRWPATTTTSPILHETGHALGLKHGHEATASARCRRRYDCARIHGDDLPDATSARRRTSTRPGPVDFPQTFMMLDIAALQHLYGADFTTNAGDTTYSWSPSTGAHLRRRRARDRAGRQPGVPDHLGRRRRWTPTTSRTTRTDLEDRPRARAATRPSSAAQLADLGGGPNGGHARGNVFNALQYRGDPRSLIENAVGGGGDDAITGNAARNRLDGGAGGDRLAGRDERGPARRRRGRRCPERRAGGRLADGGPGTRHAAGRRRPGPLRLRYGRASPRARAACGTSCARQGGAAAFEAPGAAAGDWSTSATSTPSRAGPATRPSSSAARGRGTSG